jgi:hypothetical protein
MSAARSLSIPGVRKQPIFATRDRAGAIVVIRRT